jgi:hypothetical protein
MESKINFHSPHMFFTLIARRHGGKTVCCLRLLHDLIETYPIHHIVVYSETAKLNGSYRQFVSDRSIVGVSKMDESISKILKYQSQQPKNKRETWIIVLDDIPLNKLSPQLGMLASAGRHYNLCVIICCQYSKNLVSPIVRNNTDIYMLGEISKTAAQPIYDNFVSRFHTFQEFYDFYSEQMKNDYTFVCYDARQKNRDTRVFTFKAIPVPETTKISHGKKYRIKNDKVKSK